MFYLFTIFRRDNFLACVKIWNCITCHTIEKCGASQPQDKCFPQNVWRLFSKRLTSRFRYIPEFRRQRREKYRFPCRMSHEDICDDPWENRHVLKTLTSKFRYETYLNLDVNAFKHSVFLYGPSHFFKNNFIVITRFKFIDIYTCSPTMSFVFNLFMKPWWKCGQEYSLNVHPLR